MANRIFTFLGLAMKAGKLISGEEACEKAIVGHKAEVIIIAGDASENTKKHFSDMCKYREIEMRVFGTRELIGKYIGKEKRAVIAILDKGFAKRTVELIDNSNIDNNNMEIGGERNGET